MMMALPTSTYSLHLTQGSAHQFDLALTMGLSSDALASLALTTNDVVDDDVDDDDDDDDTVVDRDALGRVYDDEW
ncbi:Aste57867_8295 [Aphanomyces stellatus]|uniref:Aste57867_8295 protein n=1 Tax=Aphanomyces stellatus TaxID=120398 RepID=A0A485KJV3_9STRA|nr:hypothetical protein As57867_008264 [Aphanomyces stellatus]VFT85182.1 Aste57867_8295 [Aphanomyces stellatus]